METYQIRINNQLYESNAERIQAEYLYKSVDNTCLSIYYGKIKTLVKMSDGCEEILRKDTIKSPRKGIHF